MRPFAMLPAALLTLMLAFSIAVGTPIQAEAKNKGVSQSKVFAACKRTAGCKISGLGGGDYIGSTPNVNFICRNGKCFSVPAIKGNTPGKGAILGGIRLPPGTVHPTSGGNGNATRHPVNVDAPNRPTKIKTPIASGKGGGMNQSGGHHR
jgi:hypothetical protein